MIDLKGKRVFVHTNPELGWDCVVGVYLADTEKDVIEYLDDEYDDEMDIIHSMSLNIIKNKAEIRDEKIDKIIE